MYNKGKNNHHHYYNNFPSSSVTPRISFSNDFVESQDVREAKVPSTYPETATAPSSDFEFSVTNHSMMSADELFFKGRILPLFRGSRTKMLREELLVEDEDEGEASLQLTRGSGGIGRRWKGLLSLRKAGKKGESKKCEEGAGDRVFDNYSSQEMLKDGVVNKFRK